MFVGRAEFAGMPGQGNGLQGNASFIRYQIRAVPTVINEIWKDVMILSKTSTGEYFLTDMDVRKDSCPDAEIVVETA